MRSEIRSLRPEVVPDGVRLHGAKGCVKLRGSEVEAL